jgi:hypothetical protein
MVGEEFYVSAFDGTDVEPWHFDGQSMTKLDLTPGSGSTRQATLAVAGKNRFLITPGNPAGTLWRVNGDKPVKLVADPAQPNLVVGENVALDGALYLVAQDDQSTPSSADLYHYDGVTFTRIFMAGHDGPVHNLTVVGNALYVVTPNINGINELWRVAGTTAAKAVIDQSGPLLLTSLTPVSDTLYLLVSANTVGAPPTLWRVQGTTAALINLDHDGLSPAYALGLMPMGDTLYFAANLSDSEHDVWVNELWKVNGTNATRLEVPGSFGGAYFGAVAGDALYLLNISFSCLAGEIPPGPTIWQVKGDVVTPVQPMIICPTMVKAVGDRLYVGTGDQRLYGKLWEISDTTATKIEINSAYFSIPSDFTVLGNSLYLGAFDGTDRELYRVTGLTPHKIDLLPGQPSGEVRGLFATPTHLYFSGWGAPFGGNQLWTLDSVASSLFLPMLDNTH